MKILEILTDKRDIGNVGERAAAKHLRKNGFRILRKNYVALGYEIDIIAEDKEFLIFVEVKTRTLGKETPKESRPAASVTPEKQGKIILAAKWFKGEYLKKRKMRFDIIEVYVDKRKKVQKVLHLESAFNADTAKAVIPRTAFN